MNHQEAALLAVALIFLCDLVERIFGQRQVLWHPARCFATAEEYLNPTSCDTRPSKDAWVTTCRPLDFRGSRTIAQPKQPSFTSRQSDFQLPQHLHRAQSSAEKL